MWLFKGKMYFIKHFLHVFTFIVVILSVQFFLVDFSGNNNFNFNFLSTVVLFIKCLTLLALPQCIFNAFGLLFYNAFPQFNINNVKKTHFNILPTICFRVVTRGNYPNLVRQTVANNLKTCLEFGLSDFRIEVVSDKPIEGLPFCSWIRETVVPEDYVTVRETLFKARALQYSLEDGVNDLADDDCVVHLDEETILTVPSIHGIVNFIHTSDCDFGQGVIAYGNGEIVNLATTLIDSFRVADDMGKLRAQFNLFHRPLFSWKGSFAVSRVR